MKSTNVSFSRTIIAATLSVGTFGLCSCGSQTTPTTAGNASIQSSVATSVPLATVGSGDSSVATAVDATDVATLGSDVGNKASVKGTISSVIYPPKPTDNITIYFAGQSATTDVARALVPATEFNQIPDLRGYIGKQILITGPITMGKRYPMVTLMAATDIKAIQ